MDEVPDGDFHQLLKENTSDVLNFFGSLPPQKHSHTYAKGKWTVKQVLQHIIDTERVFSYRALVVSRGDLAQLPAFDEDDYVAKADTSDRSMQSLLEEFAAVRQSTAMLFANMTNADSAFLGNGPAHPVSARALGFMLIGHARHHLQVVADRY
jgi:uncharacterized damage-inducible protein DinB